MQKANNGSILLVATGTLLVLLFMQSCVAVKPYQRMYLNDESMQLGKTGMEKFDENVHTYREGSSGGGSGKSSGGCGCN
jgi:hypothetical protein